MRFEDVRIGTMVMYQGYKGRVQSFWGSLILVDFNGLSDFCGHRGNGRLLTNTGWWVSERHLSVYEDYQLSNVLFGDNSLKVIRLIDSKKNHVNGVVLNGEVIIDNLKIPRNCFDENCYSAEHSIQILHTINVDGGA